MRLAAPMRIAAVRLTLPLLILASIGLMLLSKADLAGLDRARVVVDDAMAPLLSTLVQPVDTVAGGVRSVEAMATIYSENNRLREENARLLQWQEVAHRLMNENAELRSLAKLAPEKPLFQVSGQVIADAGGAFARTVLINVGRGEGVARGQAAMTGEGLIGRVVEVGERAARVLLLTDLNSRIPVAIEESGEHAVLAGDNSEQPKLLYVSSKSALKVGARIVTQGSGGVFPPGLPVGVIASTPAPSGEEVARVEPYTALSRLDYVRIVDYGLAGVLPQSMVPAPKAPRPSRGNDAKH